ncbi:lysozyme inhibitor LprI family protein (plasmid) [Deinococcus radiomollis]|uniref:lysozyme inhibitor LprI family protein n=1 Tax=Deinococcus radiomollis TaxID=468916 RepID=UPI0038925D18
MRRMISIAMSTTLMVASLTGPSAAHAQTNCDMAGSPFEHVYCDAKTVVKADDDLNIVYQKLLKLLSPAGKASLRSYQRAWVAQRDAATTSTGSDDSPLIDLRLAVKMTTARVNFLNDRYRECLSSGCQPSKLN